MLPGKYPAIPQGQAMALGHSHTFATNVDGATFYNARTPLSSLHNNACGGRGQGMITQEALLEDLKKSQKMDVD
jgi:hypothetical protein